MSTCSSKFYWNKYLDENFCILTDRYHTHNQIVAITQLRSIGNYAYLSIPLFKQLLIVYDHIK